MDEKDLIKRTKNSLKAKKSLAEILNNFQKRGFKLEYAEEIIKKANNKKKILTVVTLSLIILIFFTVSGYAYFYSGDGLENPFGRFSLTGNAIGNQKQIPISQIEITPEYVSFILQEIGATRLHKNPLTFQNPIINTQIDDKTFSSIIGRKIETKTGFNEEADIQFTTDKLTLLTILSSENPKSALKESIIDGKIQIETKTSQTELASKGYLKIYNSLK